MLNWNGWRALAQIENGPGVAGRRLKRGRREVFFEVLVQPCRHQVLCDHAERRTEDQARLDLPREAQARLEVVQVLRGERVLSGV